MLLREGQRRGDRDVCWQVSLGEMNIGGEAGWYSGLKIFAKDDRLIDNTTGKEEGDTSRSVG